MKAMFIAETADEIALVKELWEAHKSGKHTFVQNDMAYVVDGSMFCTADRAPAIAYVYEGGHDPAWHIYNFAKGVEERVEGDLAGLANSKEGNFPFFN